MYNIKNKPYILRKVIATIIDYGLIFFIIFFYTLKFGVRVINEEGTFTLTGISKLIPIILWVIWLPGSEYIFSRTIGHWIVGFKVVEISGKKADFIQTMQRRIADIVDLFFWGIPAMISINKSKHNQRLGDLWSETAIISLDDEKYIKENTGG